MATLLERLAKKLGERDDAALHEEIDDLAAEKRELQRTHRLFVERAHAAIDTEIANAEASLEKWLRGLTHIQAAGLPTELVQQIGALAAFPAVAARWHALVDEAAAAGGSTSSGVGFSPLTLEQYDRQLARISSEIETRRVELQRRQASREREEADAELAQLEKQLELDRR